MDELSLEACSLCIIPKPATLSLVLNLFIIHWSKWILYDDGLNNKSGIIIIPNFE